jgi:hypothetical protein
MLVLDLIRVDQMNERERDLARQRQLRKRRRDREKRLNLQAQMIAARLPPEWRRGWQKLVKRHANARAEEESAKISLAKLSKRYAREQIRAGRSDAARRRWECEGYEPDWVDERIWAAAPSRGTMFLFGENARDLMIVEADSTQIRPGSKDWWLVLVYADGGLDVRSRPYWSVINPIATDYRREARRLREAARWHSVCVTSRPEYGLPAAGRAGPVPVRLCNPVKKIKM